MAKWSDDEIYEYYKTGKKPTGVTDQNYELGLNNYLKTEKSNLLDSNLAQQQSSLVKQQTNAQQSASISNASLQRYLGKSSLASGAATGQVGTNFVNANNAYQQNRAAINSDFSAQNQALLQKYLDNKTQIQEDFSTKQTGILDKYYGRSRDALADSRYEDELAYNRSRDALSDTRYEDETQYQRDLDAYRKLIEEDERKYSRDRDALSDSRYTDETAYNRNEAEYMKTTDSQTRVYTQLLDDLRDGYFNTAAEFRARVEEMKSYMNEQDYDYLSSMSHYLSDNLGQKKTDEAYASGTTVETEQEIANKWAAYKQTYKGNEYSGSEPTITSNGYLTVTAGGKQMYAYKEVDTSNLYITPSRDPYDPSTWGKTKLMKEIDKWASAALAGGIPDGAVMQAEAGKHRYVMYYKGKFYLVGDDASKASATFKQ